MKFIKLLFLAITVFISNNFAFSDDIDANWITATATIKNVEKAQEGVFRYDITYPIKVSDHIGDDDKYIKSPVEQSVLDSKLPPIEGQNVQIRYFVSAPETYEILTPIKYKYSK